MYGHTGYIFWQPQYPRVSREKLAPNRPVSLDMSVLKLPQCFSVVLVMRENSAYVR